MELDSSKEIVGGESVQMHNSVSVVIFKGYGGDSKHDFVDNDALSLDEVYAMTRALNAEEAAMMHVRRKQMLARQREMLQRRELFRKRVGSALHKHAYLTKNIVEEEMVAVGEGCEKSTTSIPISSVDQTLDHAVVNSSGKWSYSPWLRRIWHAVCSGIDFLIVSSPYYTGPEISTYNILKE